MKGVTVITHPLVRHNLTRLRDRHTQPQEFRRVLSEIAVLLLYEATRSFGVRRRTVATPLQRSTGYQLQREVVLVPVLRAGLGMLDAILQLLPNARVGFIGLKREESTLRAISITKACPGISAGSRSSSLNRCSPPAAARGRAGFAGHRPGAACALPESGGRP